MTTGRANWAGNVRFAAAELAAPESVPELQELVAGRRRVHALGAGHSFTPVADTDGTLVSLHRLAGGVRLSEDARRAWVPAGATYARVAAELHARGWALHNLASVPHVTVAGACATGTHGSGPANPGLAAAVTALELVHADGTLATIRQGDDRFPAVVVGLGALGIVTAVELAVEPAYEVTQEVWLDVPLARVQARLADVLGAGDSVSLFTGWSTPDSIDQVWVKRRVAVGGDPRAPSGAGSGSGTGVAAEVGELAGGRRAGVAVHPVAGLDPAAATEQLGRPGPWHERLPHFRADAVPSAGAELQSEWLLPVAAGPDALDRLRALAGALATAAFVCEIRAVAADELWLSPAYRRETVAVHVTWRPDPPAAAEAIAAVEAALAPYDPRPHWGKLSGMEPAALAVAYPRLDDFRAVAEALDPERTFANRFVDRALRR
ncbi:MAG TPA: D-arabinono-1,4-lactone oxidase [Acidimicrobiales bacterium]|nr:D-arabinono-1,4-lactone oxidase [Acidimicrobiales bacterium]